MRRGFQASWSPAEPCGRRQISIGWNVSGSHLVVEEQAAVERKIGQHRRHAGELGERCEGNLFLHRPLWPDVHTAAVHQLLRTQSGAIVHCAVLGKSASTSGSTMIFRDFRMQTAEIQAVCNGSSEVHSRFTAPIFQTAWYGRLADPPCYDSATVLQQLAMVTGSAWSTDRCGAAQCCRALARGGGGAGGGRGAPAGHCAGNVGTAASAAACAAAAWRWQRRQPPLAAASGSAGIDLVGTAWGHRGCAAPACCPPTDTSPPVSIEWKNIGKEDCRAYNM